MAASGGSDSDRNRKEAAELGVKDERPEGGGGSGGEQQAAAAAGANGSGGGGGGGGGAAAAASGGTVAASGKERDYIWTEDAVHVLLDHFLEKYMSYEKGMIRNADWVEIAQRVNQQLDGNKPVKTPEQCKNKVDNLKKQYRKERRRGSLGPTSTNWAFFSRMHDIFESDYKKAGLDASAAAGGTGGAAAATAAATATATAAEEIQQNHNKSNSEEPQLRPRSSVVPDHYLASREFLRKQDELLQYKRQYNSGGGGASRRSETPPPPPQPPLMLLPPDHLHHQHHQREAYHHQQQRHSSCDREAPARKKAKGGDSREHQQQRHHQHHQHHQQHHGGADGGGGSPSSESGGNGGDIGGGGKFERKLHRHQLAALRRDFMEGFTGFAEVMLKIEVAKMEMQRDLERQRAEMELHRTQMMLSNQLQLAKYLKSSPAAAAGSMNPLQHHPQQEAGGFWPHFGFADGATAAATAATTATPATTAASGGQRLQLAIPIFPDFTALDAVGPYEVLHLLPNVEVLFVSHQPGLYAAGMGMLTLQATASFEQVTRPQIVVVPGGAGTRRLLQDRPILDWIRKVHEHTLYTASVCTGSLLLGAAGLLKGIEATTHWNAHDRLAEFGAKPVSQRIVRQGKIITAAGVSAGIDMALQLAALLTDDATAKMLQLYIEYDPQPPFDTGSVIKAGPELTNRAKELSSKLLAQLAGSGAGAGGGRAAA